MKRLYAVLIILVLMIVSSIPLFAKTAAGLPNYVYLKETKTTEQFFVNITRPATTESVYKREYSVSGQTDYEGIRVQLLRFNSSTGIYEEYMDMDEESFWDIGSSGWFMKGVELNDNENSIRVVAFQKANVGNENALYQINDFKVTLKDESIIDKCKALFFKAAEAVNAVGKNIDTIR